MQYQKSQYYEPTVSTKDQQNSSKLHYGAAYVQQDNRNSIELPQNTFEYNKIQFPEVDKRARVNQSYDFSNASSKSIPGQGL